MRNAAHLLFMEHSLDLRSLVFPNPPPLDKLTPPMDEPLEHPPLPSKINIPQQPSLTKRLLSLTLTFGKFGGITFGGGYAIVALLEEDLVQRKHWLSSGELLDIITVGESTPGAIAVNTATFVGYRVAGLPGGIVATAALVFPAWLVIVLLSSCYLILRENHWIAAALAGIRVAAVVLIVRAFLRMGKSIGRSWINLSAMIIAFGLVVFTPINAIFIVLGGLFFGVLWFGVRPRLFEHRGA